MSWLSGQNGFYYLMDVDDSCTMSDAARANDVDMVCGYYQVGTRTEDVKKNKFIVLVRKKDGACFDDPNDCRKKLGLKPGTDAKFKANAGPEYDIFVQSTSSNRALKPGTKVLFSVHAIPPGAAKTQKPTKPEKKNVRGKKESEDEEEEEEEVEQSSKTKKLLNLTAYQKAVPENKLHSSSIITISHLEKLSETAEESLIDFGWPDFSKEFKKWMSSVTLKKGYEPDDWDDLIGKADEEESDNEAFNGPWCTILCAFLSSTAQTKKKFLGFFKDSVPRDEEEEEEEPKQKAAAKRGRKQAEDEEEEVPKKKAPAIREKKAEVEEEKEAPKKKAPARRGKKATEEEEEEEEEEKAPKRKAPTKRGKKDDSESEDEAPPKKATGKRAKKEESEEEEEEIPKKKQNVSSSPVEEKVKAPGLAFVPGKAKDCGSYPYGLSWTNIEPTLMCLDSPTLPGSDKIVGFDMDSTLVVPKSGAKFPTGASDWKWWNPAVVPKLQEYHKNGYKLVIFTNQAGIEKGKQKASDITTKILALSKEAGVPLQAFIAAATNHWRKPHRAMWDELVENHNQGVTPDMSKCIFVGDAAGRPKNWQPGAVKDFGCGDRKFGANIGALFMTPEEFFLGLSTPAPFSWDSLDPAKFLKSVEGLGNGFSGSSITKPTQEMIVFCARPASGKSTFVRTHLSSYVWVNRDTLKTPAKCVKAARDALESGKSVVIDNTSPDPSTRAEYVRIAKDAGVPVRCFVFDLPKDVSEHLNFFREAFTKGEVRRVPDVGFNMFTSKYKAPTTAEGFSEISTVKFVPQFKSEKDRQLFLEWTE